MSPSARATHLRQRAQHLRELAEAIEAMPAMRLEHYADDDTWQGRRPQFCRTLLATNQHQLYGAADDLRVTSMQFERQADELDAMARAGLAG